LSVETGTSGSTLITNKITNSPGETISSIDNRGKTVLTRYFASGLPKEMQIQGESYLTRFTYDIYGNRDNICDPDAGIKLDRLTTKGRKKLTT
jgi:hypothetical protein